MIRRVILAAWPYIQAFGLRVGQAMVSLAAFGVARRIIDKAKELYKKVRKK